MFYKKDEVEIDVYILCLHKFEDDKVILDDNELKNASKAIKECLDSRGYLEKGPEVIEKWYVYTLCPLNLLDKEELPNEIHSKLHDEIYCNITKAELGYYHHRTIAKFRLRYPKCDFSCQREIRQELKKKSGEIIEDCVKNRINNLTLSGEMSNKGIIRFLYTYPFIIVKEKKGIVKSICTYLSTVVKGERETIPFSQETGTLSFEIYELGRFRYKRRVMRVSGPSIFLYADGDVGTRLVRDIINAIYQHCLYEKKLRDEEKGTFENILDESILVKLWTHIINTMGGRHFDVLLSRITFAMYILTILAIIITVITFILNRS